MESSLKLQMDVRNNAEDLRSYMLGLQNWEEEMKRKEIELKSGGNDSKDLPPPRNKIKRYKTDNQTKVNSDKKQKRINAYDYSAWDKYDADKACEELDGGSEKQESEEESTTVAPEAGNGGDDKECDNPKSLKNIDEAFYEKELGNQFVRKEKWEDAITCYTKAIELDPKNAIYYANRALCFIKLKNFKTAEVDSTIAIQLDETYVKAYQRRAFARSSLGQYNEAKADYTKILELEPNNATASYEISKLNKKLSDNKLSGEKERPIFDPKHIFKPKSVKLNKVDEGIIQQSTEKICVSSEKSEDISTKMTVTTVKERVKEQKVLDRMAGGDSELNNKDNSSKEEIVTKPKSSVFGNIPDGFSLVKPVQIPPHLRSKKQMKRVPVKNVVSDSETFDEFINLCNSQPEGCGESQVREALENPKVVTQKAQLEELDSNTVKQFPVPETCVQFQNAWKLIRNNSTLTHLYLKKVDPKKLSNIFKHSLESDLFSELIRKLSDEEIAVDSDLVYSFLYHLSNVQRFGSLVMFMSSLDRDNLKKCISSLKRTRSPEELKELCALYELPDSLEMNMKTK